MSTMSLKQVYERVTGCPLNDWVDILNDKLNDYQIGSPSMEEVVRNYAFPVLYDYNERVHSMKGNFTEDHRVPGDKERREMSEIVVALLIKRQIISEYDLELPILDEVYNRLSELQNEKESKQ